LKDYFRIRFILSSLFILLIFLVPVTAESKISVLDGLTYEKIVSIGEAYQGSILIKNHDNVIREVKLYQRDYLFFCDGSNIYGNPGEDIRSNANWISLNPSLLSIPPQGSSAVNYIITVPRDNSLVGTYWSMIMVEEIQDEDPILSNNDSDDSAPVFGIRNIVRYGIQMVTHIGDKVKSDLKILNHELVFQQDNDYSLYLDIENTGEQWLRLEVWAKLIDEQEGNITDKFDGGRHRIYPGTSVRCKIDLKNILKGNYKLLVILKNYDERIWGINYNLKL